MVVARKFLLTLDADLHAGVRRLLLASVGGVFAPSCSGA